MIYFAVMSTYTDQLQHTITLHGTPRKIVSLVPSQTELLYDLGLTGEVVGITKFCVHPDLWFRSKPRIGGTKNINIEKVKSLSPDLIIANKEENVQEQVESLRNIAPVYTSDIHDLDSALDMMASIGDIVNRKEKAQELIHTIQQGFASLTVTKPLRCCYLIWKDPFMSIGHDTFIHDMLQRCKLQNIFASLTRYPCVTIEDIQQANCDVLLLSSEPYPFKEKHIQELQSQLPNTITLLADGEMFSWYGSRLLHAPAYFKQLLATIHNKA